MSDKKNNIFVRILRCLLEEWIKALLLALATLVLGTVVWIFRHYIQLWIISSHAIKLVGWLWVLVFSLILLIPIFLFWFIIYKLKRDKYTNEIDVKNILTDYWLERKKLHGGRHRWMNKPQGEFTIHCSNVDKRIHLKKGSAAKFLPEIIENDSTHCIKSKGRETIVVQRKGLTMKVGPDSPNGIILQENQMSNSNDFQKAVKLIFVEQFTAPLWSRLCWFCLRTNDIRDKLNGMPNCVSYHIHNLRNVVAW